MEMIKKKAQQYKYVYIKYSNKLDNTENEKQREKRGKICTYKITTNEQIQFALCFLINQKCAILNYLMYFSETSFFMSAVSL